MATRYEPPQRPTVPRPAANTAGPRPAARPVPRMVNPTTPAPASPRTHPPQAPEPEQPEKASRAVRLGVRIGLAIVVLLFGGLYYFMELKPNLDFAPKVVKDSWTRNALEDNVPVVDYQKYISNEALMRYYKEGDGLELRFFVENDPRKGYVKTEMPPCKMEAAADFNFTQAARQVEAEALPAKVKKCVEDFLAPISRTVPISIGADVTEGKEQVAPKIKEVLADPILRRELTGSVHTHELHVFFIFDAPYRVSNIWHVPPKSSAEQVGSVLAEVEQYLLNTPLDIDAGSSIGLGLLNGLSLRASEDLRGGLVYIISDGLEYVPPSLKEAVALNFYEGRSNPHFFNKANWDQFDQRILAYNNNQCPKLHGAKVHWYFPAVKDLLPRKTAPYWEHFFEEKCGAGSFMFHT